jgi:hypothetical protein
VKERKAPKLDELRLLRTFRQRIKAAGLEKIVTASAVWLKSANSAAGEAESTGGVAVDVVDPLGDVRRFLFKVPRADKIRALAQSSQPAGATNA